MKIVLLGGDARFASAAAYLQAWGCKARQAAAPEECRGADVLLAPSQEEALPAAEGSRETFCVVQRGGTEALRERGHACASLEEDEEYLQANAVLTAEGALAAAIGCEGRALWQSRCCVLGYGRVARALARMLVACGANVAVAVRPGPSAARASRDGMPRVHIAECEDALRRARFVWNTVPTPVLDGEKLRLLPGDAILFDLASAPYGFDLEAARALGLRARRLPALPGRYCPDTAGAVVAEALLRAARERRDI